MSDPLRVIASPFRTVDIVNPDQGIRVVADLVQEWYATELVVGLPLSLSGDEGPMAFEVRQWAERLGSSCRLPVHLIDERLTSVEADRVSHVTGRRTRSDDIAAALLLQAYLEERR
jgi:putative Holliday junction resolvase